MNKVIYDSNMFPKTLGTFLFPCTKMHDPFCTFGTSTLINLVLFIQSQNHHNSRLNVLYFVR